MTQPPDSELGLEAQATERLYMALLMAAIPEVLIADQQYRTMTREQLVCAAIDSIIANQNAAREAAQLREENEHLTKVNREIRTRILAEEERIKLTGDALQAEADLFAAKAELESRASAFTELLLIHEVLAPYKERDGSYLDAAARLDSELEAARERIGELEGLLRGARLFLRLVADTLSSDEIDKVEARELAKMIGEMIDAPTLSTPPAAAESEE